MCLVGWNFEDEYEDEDSIGLTVLVVVLVLVNDCLLVVPLYTSSNCHQRYKNYSQQLAARSLKRSPETEKIKK